MADVFTGHVAQDSALISDVTGTVGKMYGPTCYAKYAAHAINSHDELVAEVERLRGVIDELERENDSISVAIPERASAFWPYI